MNVKKKGIIMDVLYTVTMSYPDGHLEEIEEAFPNEEKAKEYGEKMLNYIKSTETYKGGAILDDENELAPRKPRKPYYMIIKVVGHEKAIVFESKH